MLAKAVPVRLLSGAPAPEYAWLRLQSGIPVALQVQAVRRHLPVAVLIVLSDTPSDDEGMQIFSAGARGYCNSHASEAVLRQVFAVVSKGGLWIGESLMKRLLAGINRLQPVDSHINPASTKGSRPEHVIDQLTDRQREVARAIATGASNKEIARQLGITERTVKAHVGAILSKLEVPDRLRLALLFRQLH